MTPTRKIFAFLVAAAICLGVPARLGAQSTLPEAAVKAAFIYNFAKFIQWPENIFKPGESQFTICVWGEDALRPALAQLQGKTVRGSKIHIRKLATPEAGNGCHIVYISRSASGRTARIVRQVSRKHVLTVGDLPSFIEGGGIINLIKAESRVRFEINLEAARVSGLKFSARLLRLAKIHRKGK